MFSTPMDFVGWPNNVNPYTISPSQNINNIRPQTAKPAPKPVLRPLFREYVKECVTSNPPQPIYQPEMAPLESSYPQPQHAPKGPVRAVRAWNQRSQLWKFWHMNKKNNDMITEWIDFKANKFIYQKQGVWNENQADAIIKEAREKKSNGTYAYENQLWWENEGIKEMRDQARQERMKKVSWIPKFWE